MVQGTHLIAHLLKELRKVPSRTPEQEFHMQMPEVMVRWNDIQNIRHRLHKERNTAGLHLQTVVAAGRIVQE